MTSFQKNCHVSCKNYGHLFMQAFFSKLCNRIIQNLKIVMGPLRLSLSEHARDTMFGGTFSYRYIFTSPISFGL